MPDPGPIPSSQADWLQVRIFEGILRLLGRLGETNPILLIVEDAHWADRSTRDLLAFLARTGRDERLFIVATFRSDELHRRHPLTGWLAEAERQSRVDRIDLTRFDRDELVEMIGMIAGDQLGPSLVDSIARRSDGNAFFAEELVAATESSRSNHDGLPDTLRGLLLVRLAGTTEDAGHLVEIAAVAGREVEYDVLAEVCGLSETDLSRALHEALDAQLLFVAGTGSGAGAGERYAFRHALVQEAAYDQLLPSERRVLHGAYARAIEARPAGAGAAQANRLVELAHHWAAAQESTLALHAALGAGDASQTVYAYAEAAREYERATELWDVVPARDRPTDRDLADIFDSAASAAIVIGDAARAVSLARKALELVDAAPDAAAHPERRARAREQLGFASWLAGDTATSIQRLEEAVDLLDGTPASTEQARVLAGLAANLMLAGQAARSIPFAERAIATAREVGEAGIESRAMNTLGVDRVFLGSIAAGIELLRAALSIAKPIDDPTELPRAYANLGSILEMGGFVEEALEVSLEGAERTAALWQQPQLPELPAGQCRGHADRAGAIRRRRRTCSRASCPTSCRASARSSCTTPGRTWPCGPATLPRPDGTSRSRSSRRAASTTRSTSSTWPPGGPRSRCGTAIRPPPWRWPVDGFDRLVDVDDAIILGLLAIPAAHAAADLAVRARAARDEPAAKEAAAAARTVIDRYRTSTERLSEPDELATQQIGWRMDLCEAEYARAAGEDDPARWLAVHPALAARPAPFLEAYVLWRAAEALADRGETGAAAEPLREAHAIATRIGAGLLSAGIDTTARRLRVTFAASPDGLPAADEVVVEPADPFGLTSREREVLGLVAEGYTNKRIAETLFISESTAGVHVSNILGKLGVATRTEAAAVAVRLGLDRAGGVAVARVASSARRHSRSRLRSAALTRSSSVDSTPTSASAARDASRASASE